MERVEGLAGNEIRNERNFSGNVAQKTSRKAPAGNSSSAFRWKIRGIWGDWPPVGPGFPRKPSRLRRLLMILLPPEKR